MIQETAELIYSEELSAIAKIEEAGKKSITEHCRVCAHLASTYLTKLKEMVLNGSFESEEEEIAFFRETKPRFAHLLIYYTSLERIELARPEGSISHLKDYYDWELKGIKRFFNMNRHIYAYYRSGDRKLDTSLFVRGKEGPPSWLCKPPLDSDDRFSTAADFMFAKILAKEKLTRYLEHALQNPNTDLVEPHVQGEKMIWTGDSINLLENAYGWYHTGQVNNGKASIIDIVRILENALHVKIGRPYRRLTEIKQRKRLSRTKFIDEMGKTFIQKLDEEDEYRPSD